ncbi:2-hydroxyacid dehydrogenase [Amaricoccus sp.]|uniref:2-hydroxyacid dehydrogenase n=1 Tax=Amaricoccus sp. TaxID=1872485 RepID=UPI0026020232|nr:2-hydroxyacid dehydrogenase [uncultured Amaricoccus sp.]
MKLAVFSARGYDRASLNEANAKAGSPCEIVYFESRLDARTAVLARGAVAICAFVNDALDAAAVGELAGLGVKLVALRCAGFNNVDLEACAKAGIAVGRVPAYSPESVAEHAIALILTLNRKIHRAHSRVRDGNFELDGLLGFDLGRRVAGVVGTGAIGLAAARILRGFGCEVLGSDPFPGDAFPALGGRYVPLDTLFAEADVITLHCPLTSGTRHMVDADTLARMKPGVMLINTSRGALVDTAAVIEGLKSGHVGALGLDVYEEEQDLFFRDLSNTTIQDDVFARLLTFNNVVITGHQGFFTADALTEIAETTIANLASFLGDGRPLHPVTGK